MLLVSLKEPSVMAAVFACRKMRPTSDTRLHFKR